MKISPSPPTILVGVDASSRSEDAVAFAAHLARASHARVVVACAFDFDSAHFVRGTSVAMRDELHAQALTTATEHARKLWGVPAERIGVSAPADPSPAHALHQLALSESAGLIIVGSTHTGKLDRIVPGSTGEALLHGAPCPVVVVPSGYRHRPGSIGRIGVACDGSPESRAALRAGHAAARALDAELELISVLDTGLRFMPATHGGPPAQPTPALRRELEADLQSLLDKLDDVRATGSVLEGDAADELAQRSHELDLLVAGSRGYGPLRAVLTGGVSGRLVRAAGCPLMIVPRGVEAPLGALFHAQTEIA